MSLPPFTGCLLMTLVFVTISVACQPVPYGRGVELPVRARAMSCFTVQVNAAKPLQIVISQPVNLSVRLFTSTTSTTKLDSFDFGEETITFDTGGTYRIAVRPVPRVVAARTHFVITQRHLPLQEARIWKKAESLATKSAETNSPDDIAQSLQLWEQIGDESRIARTSIRQGSAALHRGDAASAWNYYEKAYWICDALDDIRCRAEAANDSGLAARRIGDIDSSRRRLEQAESDWRRLSLWEASGITLSNLGLLLWQTGDLQQAISSYSRARRELRGRNTLAYARVLNNLGLYYLSLNEYEKASGYFSRALAEFARRNSLRDEVRARLNLGRTYMLSGDLVRAQRLLLRAVAQAETSGDHAAIADASNNLGQALFKTDSITAAEPRLKTALEQYQVLHDRRGEASARHFLGLIAARRLDFQLARQRFQDAVTIRLDTGLRNDAASSLVSLAELERDEGRFREARDRAEQALKLVEAIRYQIPSSALRASYYAGVRRMFQVRIDATMQDEIPNRTELGFLAVERGRAQALLDAVTEQARALNIPENLRQRQTALQQRLGQLSFRLASASESQQRTLRPQAQRLLAEEQELEAQWRQATGPGALAHEPVTLEAVSASLPRDCTLIEYHLGEKNSYVWVLDSDSLRAFPLPPSREVALQVSRFVSLFEDILERRRSPSRQQAFERAMRQLSATLLGPLKDVSLRDRVVIAPDGVLYSVPFAALRISSRNRSLGLIKDVIQIPAAAYLAKGKEPRPLTAFPKTILAIADPVFSSEDSRVAPVSQISQLRPPELMRLPFTEELNTITRHVPASRRRILRGFAVTPDSLRSAGIGSYAIVHFSTHALIDNQIPEMSRVALSLVDARGRTQNGFLRPYDMAQWQLDGSLVVLSACQTALGRQVLGEGMVGFASSLLFAGASQLIATLVKIDDEASSAFFNEVYKRILTQPVRTEHAMTLARQALARSKRWGDPYHWASYVVIGRPSS